MDKVKVSDKLLLSVEKPARYTGGELNSEGDGAAEICAVLP